MIPIREEAGLAAALAEDCAILFKHSTRCGTSAWALRQLERFEASSSEVPVYLVDVIADRPLSNLIAERLGIVHQSPQAIVLAAGRPVWSASHSRVTADALAGAVRAASPPVKDAADRG